MQISRRSRLKFADFACDFAILRLIDQAFLGEDFGSLQDYSGPEHGQRRGLVGSYHAAINVSDSDQVGRLINVYVDAINSWGRNQDGVFYPGAADHYVGEVFGIGVRARGAFPAFVPISSRFRRRAEDDDEPSGADAARGDRANGRGRRRPWSDAVVAMRFDAEASLAVGSASPLTD
jgi:hypothetical protein